MAASDQIEEEKEFKLSVLDPADDSHSLSSSNRSSITSDTDLMVRDCHQHGRTTVDKTINLGIFER